MSGLAALAIREVHELHAFFVRWLGQGAGDPARIGQALDAGFRMVTPDGCVLERDAVIAGLASAAGRRGRDFGIVIEDASAMALGARHVLVAYVERQHGAGPTTARHSSALFRRSPDAPCGVAWLHLHETWIP